MSITDVAAVFGIGITVLTFVYAGVRWGLKLEMKQEQIRTRVRKLELAHKEVAFMVSKSDAEL